jgi:hypothetical protein
MNFNIFNINEILLNNILFIQSNTHNCIKILYKSKKIQPLLFQLPYLFFKDIHKNKLILPLYFKNDKYAQNSIIFFKNLDNHFIKHIYKNITNWNLNSENVEYNTIYNEVQGDDDDLYKNGVIVVNLLTSPFKTKIFDNNKKIMHFKNYEDILFGGFFIRTILEIHSLDIVDNNINVNIKLHQAKIKYNDLHNFMLSNYSFAHSDSDSNNDNTNNINDDDKHYVSHSIVETENDDLNSNVFDIIKLNNKCIVNINDKTNKCNDLHDSNNSNNLNINVNKSNNSNNSNNIEK